MRVLKLVVGDYADAPMYVLPEMKEVMGGLEVMLDGHPLFDEDAEPSSITISSEEMTEEQFDALESWEP